jgi:O-antigen ligase
MRTKRLARKNAVVGGGRTWTLAFFASVLYVIVNYVRPQERYDWLQGVPLGQFTVGLMLMGALISRTGVALGGPVGAWTLVFMGWALVGVLFSNSPADAITIYWNNIKIVGTYFLIVAAIQSQRQLYVFILFALLVYFLHTNFGFRDWVMSGFSAAARGMYVGSGFLANPNDYGAALAAFWGLSLLLATRDSGRVLGRIPVKWLHVINTALFLIAVLTSSSRGAALGVASGAAYFVAFFTAGSLKKKLTWVLVGVVVIYIFFALQSEGQSERFSHMGTEEDASAQDRFRTWGVAWEVFLDHPFLGVGTGQFLPAANFYYSGEERIYVQHNIFLQALTEMGAPGLFLLLLLILAFFKIQRTTLRRLSQQPARDPVLEAIVIGTNVSMVSFLVAGQFITVLFYPFMWLLLTIAAAAWRITVHSAPAQDCGHDIQGKRRAEFGNHPVREHDIHPFGAELHWCQSSLTN